MLFFPFEEYENKAFLQSGANKGQFLNILVLIVQSCEMKKHICVSVAIHRTSGSCYLQPFYPPSPSSSSLGWGNALVSGLGSCLHGIQRECGVRGVLSCWRGVGQQKDLRVGRAAVTQGAVLLPLPPPTGQVLRQPPPSPAPLELVLHLENMQSCCVWHSEETAKNWCELKMLFGLVYLSV